MTDDLQRGVNDMVSVEDQVSSTETPLIGGEAAQAVGQAVAPLIVSRPAPGETVTLDPVAGQVIVLDFDPAAVDLRVDGNNLLFGFDDDGDGFPDSQIVFLDLAGEGGQSVTFQVAGAEVDSNLFAGGALALEGRGEALPEEVGAGPEAVGGGGSVYNDNLGNVIELLMAQGVIPPVELQFGLVDLEDEITILEADEETLAVLLPPEAFFTTVDADGNLVLKEDATDTEVGFKAEVGDATDELTSVVIELPGVAEGDVDVGQIEADLGVGTDNQIGTIVVSEVGGVTTITIDFNDASDVENFASTFTLDAPVEDSDQDLGDATITVTAQDKTDPTVKSEASETAPVVVDAVLDEAGSAKQEETVTEDESDQPQEIGLGLTLDFVDAGFDGSLDGESDTDGSEEITDVTVTIDAGTLELGANAPAGAELRENPDGSFTLEVEDPADYGAAIAALQVEVEAGFDGEVNGTISVTTQETVPNSDGETDTSDNSHTTENGFTVTVDPVAGDPSTEFTTVDADGNLVLKEDATDTEVGFKAEVGDATDELTSVVIELPGVAEGDVDVGQIEAGLGVGTDNQIGTVVVSEVGGVTTITIDFNDASDVENFASTFTLDAPVEDSDQDLGDATITVTAQDKTDPTVKSEASETAPVVVDAVLDEAGLAKQEETATVAVSIVAQTISLGLALGFVGTANADGPKFPLSGAGAADTDGSEQVTAVTVTIDAGTLELGANAPDGAELTQNADGSFTLEVEDPADYGAAIAALQVEVEAGFDGEVGGTISVTTQETVLNGDGETDFSDNSHTTENGFTVTVSEASGVLVVGDTSDDVDGQITPHVVDTTSSDEVSGIITGKEGDDLLIGDVGGQELAGKVVNLTLLLDTSRSMEFEINFDGESITRIEALDRAVETLLDNLVAADGATVRVFMVNFANDVKDTAAFDIIVNGVIDTEALAAAKDFILEEGEDPASVAGSNTNYEAAFNEALEWFRDDSQTLDDPDINQTIFISDGQPTVSLNEDGSVNESVNGQPSLDEVLGTAAGDSTNEYEALLAEFKGVNGTVDSIGISVGNSEDNLLDQIDDDGNADNAANGDDLEEFMIDAVGVDRLSRVGSDDIDGNDGADLIFGDTINTDLLADEQNIELPPGSSWDVIEVLMGNGFFGSPADTDQVMRKVLEFLRDPANQQKYNLSDETLDSNGNGRAGGNDTIDGGAGNDTIYGQEGNDSIDGGADADLILGGTGNDTIDGGTGDDILDGQDGDDSINGGDGDDTLTGGAGSDTQTGGDGTDTFRWEATDHGRPESEGGERVYNFAGITQGAGPHSAYTFTVDLVPGQQDEGTPGDLGDISGILNGLTPAGVIDLAEATTSDYEDLAASDDDRFTTADPGAGSNSIFMMQFNIEEDPEDISEIVLKVEGRSSVNTPQGPGHLAVWNHATESWFPVERAQFSSDGEWIINLTSEYDMAEFLGGENNNELIFVLINEDTAEPLEIDHVEVNVKTEDRDVVTDTVTDFDPDEDVLDLSALLPALGGTATTAEDLLGEFLQFQFEGGNTTVRVDHNGGGTFEATLDIVLEGVDLLNGAQTEDEIIAAVQKLLDEGRLVIKDGSVVDSFTGTEGADNMVGGIGNDTMDGQAGADTMDGGADDDSMRGGAGNDSMSGGDGLDSLDGGEGADTLDGGAEADELRGGTGNDQMTGGTGSDTFRWGAADRGLPEQAGGTARYNFKDVTQGSGPHSAFKFTIDAAVGIDTGTPADLPLLPELLTIVDLKEATDTEYVDLTQDDDDDFITDQPAEDVNTGFLSQFIIEEGVETITRIELEILGRQGTDNDNGLDAHFAVWNYEVGQWDLITSEQTDGRDDYTSWTIVIGSNFDDYLGGANNDQLTMVWLNQETGQALRADMVDVMVNSAPAGPDTDTITDFFFDATADNPEEDVLDLSELLPDSVDGSTTGGALTEYLRFEYDAANNVTTIYVDHDGGSNFEATLEIVLENCDLTAGGTLNSDVEIIQAMLDGNNLTV